ncbi:MAG: cell division protein FtsA [Thermovirgaceae bacterium]|jgi:cell division protein FtsA|nr:cell division protein FtsA [Synergistales bacterium]MDI9392020.1 cell division protein FtsA [Synergistota bacterium]MDY0178857.1 cell division protein FtsA [Synergistaceae bacterium]HRW87102.1 cell division protein FtsA [Thermovirgaceae bacterium]MDD3829435.1 cell division protein FtsA [Synergistales bacterium]
MRRGKEEPIIRSGLDIGTRKISLIVTETDPLSSEMQVIAVGSARARGMSRGDIQDPDLVVESIRRAVDEAETAFDLNIRDTFLAVGPSSASVFRLEHRFPFREEGTPERPVTGKDMKDAVKGAVRAARERGEELLVHAIPLGYSVDSGSPVRDPRGLKGSELSVEVLFIGLPEDEVKRSITCAEKAGLKVLGVVHKSIASAYGSLSEEEICHGAVVVDIGAGTSTVTCVRDGAVRDVTVSPVGGDLVTQDVAKLLMIPPSKAEYLKREISLFEDPCDLMDELEFELDGEPFVATVQDVLDIVFPRMEEILFDFLSPRIEEFGQEKGLRSIVFSGGVAGAMGFLDLINDNYEIPARIGGPVNAMSLPPPARGCEFASTVGIVNYLLEREAHPENLLEPCLVELTGAPDEEQARDILILEPRRTGPGRNIKRGKGPMGGFIDALKNAFRELF